MTTFMTVISVAGMVFSAFALRMGISLFAKWATYQRAVRSSARAPESHAHA